MKRPRCLADGRNSRLAACLQKPPRPDVRVGAAQAANRGVSFLAEAYRQPDGRNSRLAACLQKPPRFGPMQLRMAA